MFLIGVIFVFGTCAKRIIGWIHNTGTVKPSISVLTSITLSTISGNVNAIGNLFRSGAETDVSGLIIVLVGQFDICTVETGG